jgi:hypothetical protein
MAKTRKDGSGHAALRREYGRSGTTGPKPQSGVGRNAHAAAPRRANRAGRARKLSGMNCRNGRYHSAQVGTQ